ncbi:MAG: cobaltochelatase subunit CobN [Desulfuromonas sp.]
MKTTALKHLLLSAWAGIFLFFATLANAQQNSQILILTTQFNHASQYTRMNEFARQAKLELSYIYADTTPAPQLEQAIGQASLVLIDSPRQPDWQIIQKKALPYLEAGITPWLQASGPARTHAGIPGKTVDTIRQYYDNGTAQNWSAMFRYLHAFLHQEATAHIPAPVIFGKTGFYHAQDARLFNSLQDYEQHENRQSHFSNTSIGFMASKGTFSAQQTEVIDYMVQSAERMGIRPLVFWMENLSGEEKEAFLKSLPIHALVNMTHIQGADNTRLFESLNIPVIQSFSYRANEPGKGWEQAASGINLNQVAVFLALPETWGLIEPTVISEKRSDTIVPLNDQIDQLLMRLRKLAALQHRPNQDKKVALMVWNHPDNDKSIAATGMNIPKSLISLIPAMQQAGYRFETIEDEQTLIEQLQRLLKAQHQPALRPELLKAGMADTLSVGLYYHWLNSLPVFYPYIQDNIGEAIQAKRRGRATVISHHTPAFSPSGLHDELKELHDLMHEYEQLEDGPIRDKTMQAITAAAIQQHLNKDLNLTEAAIREDFTAFFSVLHHHLHQLAARSVPLGLHAFGLNPEADTLTLTVLQQLGKPWFDSLKLDHAETMARDNEKIRQSPAYQLLHEHLFKPETEQPHWQALSQAEQEQYLPILAQATRYAANLQASNETAALIKAINGRFTSPGTGGDSIRDPEITSGKNMYAFDASKIPSKSAWEAAEAALDKLLALYCQQNNGDLPTKMAFSLWSSDAIRTLGGMEAQVVHALGLQPVWLTNGSLSHFDIIPAAQLKRPRIDAVIQVTGTYRDQFDSFIRKLSEAIEKLAQLDEPDNPIYHNTQSIYQKLQQQGINQEEAMIYASSRVFGNEPGQYGTGLTHRVLQNSSWEHETELAEQFLNTQGYIFSHRLWGQKANSQQPVFSLQLENTQAAAFSRSSNLHGMLSTDHPFEFLGGLSVAIRSLNGQSPTLLVSDQRGKTASAQSSASFIAEEIRSRYTNRHWINHMQQENYAGTLEIEQTINNMWGWQVMDPQSIRDDQWQHMHDVYVQDSLDMNMNQWFEQYNPNAQAQLIERMAEAIRKDYWQADATTQQSLKQRWQQLHETYELSQNPITAEFINSQLGGYGLAAQAGATLAAQEPAAQNKPDIELNENSANSSQTISGKVMKKIEQSPPDEQDMIFAIGLSFIFACLFAGALLQHRRNQKTAAINRQPD